MAVTVSAAKKTRQAPRTDGRYHAKSDMPPEFRERLIKLLIIQADSELASTQVLWPAIKWAPDAKEAYLWQKIMGEEAKHGWQLYRLLEDLGIDTRPLVDQVLKNEEGKDHRIGVFLPSTVSQIVTNWAGACMFNELMDRGGCFFLRVYLESRYEPWAQVIEQQLREEVGHQNHGHQGLKALCKTAAGRRQVQEALDSQWPLALGYFGKPDSRSHQRDVALGIKGGDPMALRAAFIEEMRGLAADLGVTLPASNEPNYLQRLPE